MQRPRKMRIELQLKEQAAVQVYDGTNGWKVRPFLNRQEIEPFTSEELKAAAEQPDLDGPLIDFEAKGSKVALEGVEQVEDRNTYKLKLTPKSGRPIHVWIDAQTFLEAKIEGQPRRLDGIEHPVEIYYRDYRNVSGVQIPFVLETKVLPLERRSASAKETLVPVEKIVIEQASINPKLDGALFLKPVARNYVGSR